MRPTQKEIESLKTAEHLGFTIEMKGNDMDKWQDSWFDKPKTEKGIWDFSKFLYRIKTTIPRPLKIKIEFEKNMRYLEIAPCIEIMKAWTDGEEIEFKHKTSIKWLKGPIPNWNFQEFDYRISPKLESATEEELNEMDDYIWVRYPQSKRLRFEHKHFIPDDLGMQFFDPIAKTWQDWGSK